VKTFNTAFLISSIAFAFTTYAQNTTDNFNNGRQTPTIEDQVAQLQQDQQGLAGRVDALSKKLASLQQEIKTLEDQNGGLSGNSSNGPKGQTNEASITNEDSTNATNGTAVDSYDVFYDRLQSDGQWFNDPTYGLIWQPSVASSDQNWRPYTDGRWVYTDRGWTWISNENFGWATYHYGRWARLNDKGWVWVPGNTWAPAWVSWRESDDYVGWAPLPPEAQSQQNVRIEGWADNYYNIGPGSYVFVKTTDLPNQSYRRFIASSQDNFDIISRTKNVTGIYFGKTGVIDSGPDYDRLVQTSNIKIDRYKLNFVQQNSQGAQFGTAARGDQLQVLAPAARLQRAATVQPKIAANIENAQVDRGWQGIDETRAKQLKQTWQTQAPVPGGLPPNPAPAKPVFARLTGQGQGTNQQEPATESRAPNPPSPNQQSNQEPNEPNAAPTPSSSPAPSPSPNERPGPTGQKPPAPTENRRQQLKQGERPESTPPGPTPAENGKSLQRRQERKKASPTPQEYQRRQGEGEGEQAPGGQTDLLQPKTDRTPQSDVKRGGSENFDQEAPVGTNEPKDKSQRKEKAGREATTPEEPSTEGEGRQQEGYRNSEKSNAVETERPTSGDKNDQSRQQSGKEKSGSNRRPAQEEKEKVEPSGQ
jgi:hypothetical protein